MTANYSEDEGIPSGRIDEIASKVNSDGDLKMPIINGSVKEIRDEKFGQSGELNGWTVQCDWATIGFKAESGNQGNA